MNLQPTRHRELPRLSPQRIPRRLPSPRDLRLCNRRLQRIQREILRAAPAEVGEADLEDPATGLPARVEVVRVVGADFSKWA
jgi:hypothetical protein